ncbi:MAG TPA: hypothetical protein VNE61_15410 [Ktedonobacteraceae bacterium]|nr:hypothetical protein [Ktedonobacteraceae bacterium]
MQRRQGPDEEFWQQATGQHYALSNGNGDSTGKHRAAPPRPSNMPRVQHPPTTPRVGRPRRGEPPRRNRRRRALIWGIVLVICAFLACFISYAIVNFFNATNATASAAQAATGFLTAVQEKDYHTAYNDLAATVTIGMPENQFTEQAQLDDSCYGPVTSYSEVAGSASVQNNSQSYTYTITRGKTTYTLQLTLQQDEQGNWKVSNFGNSNDLGPATPGASGCN